MFRVVSAVRKVVLEVRPGPVVSFPDGATVSDYGKGNDAPVIVVQNKTSDGSWQGAKPGQLIILNEVSEAIADAMLDLVEASIKGAGEEVNATIVSACSLAADNGFGDQYTTDEAFFTTKLSPAGRMIGPRTGVVKRNDRDLIRCHKDANGIIYVYPEGPEKMAYRIEPGILLNTYRMPNGDVINLKDIPTEELSQG